MCIDYRRNSFVHGNLCTNCKNLYYAKSVILTTNISDNGVDVYNYYLLGYQVYGSSVTKDTGHMTELTEVTNILFMGYN